MPDDWGDVLHFLLLVLLANGFLALARRFTRRRSRRQRAAGRTVAAARSVNGGTHPVLSPMWEAFRMTPSPGRLDVRHRLINDEVTAIAVHGVGPGDRRPRWREHWRIGITDPRVLTVRTPDGPVELAVTADQVDWLRGRLAPADQPADD